MSRYDWGQRHPGIDRLEEQISEARRAVIEHPVYAALEQRPRDPYFLSTTCSPCGTSCPLLKSLQRNLTCVEVPWCPPA